MITLDHLPHVPEERKISDGVYAIRSTTEILETAHYFDGPSLPTDVASFINKHPMFFLAAPYGVEDRMYLLSEAPVFLTATLGHMEGHGTCVAFNTYGFSRVLCLGQND